MKTRHRNQEAKEKRKKKEELKNLRKLRFEQEGKPKKKKEYKFLRKFKNSEVVKLRARKHENGSDTMEDMIKTYQPQDEDWMGFKGHEYTFHHIQEKRNGGVVKVSNGAILVEFGHHFLNWLDNHRNQAYQDYQNLFRRINANKGPIDDELLEDIYGMLLDIFYYNVYHIPRDILNRYERYTYVKKL